MKDGLEVLIIEDNHGDALLISELLHEVGILMHITVAEDGQKALDILNKENGYANALTPDFIVLDLNLPKVHGFEVLKQMKTKPELRSLPVVVMTGSLNKDDEIKARSMGVTDYRIKPVDSRDFDHTIRWLKKNLAPLA